MYNLYWCLYRLTDLTRIKCILSKCYLYKPTAWQSPLQTSISNVNVRAVAVEPGSVGFVAVFLGINITKLIESTPFVGKPGCGNMAGKSVHLQTYLGEKTIVL